jgi:hypothetical protein
MKLSVFAVHSVAWEHCQQSTHCQHGIASCNLHMICCKVQSAQMLFWLWLFLMITMQPLDEWNRAGSYDQQYCCCVSCFQFSSELYIELSLRWLYLIYRHTLSRVSWLINLDICLGPNLSGKLCHFAKKDILQILLLSIWQILRNFTILGQGMLHGTGKVPLDVDVLWTAQLSCQIQWEHGCPWQ